ncbi:DUF4190 domain-containing protein [Telluribacter humicola]|uniref:DUF4190 domain-containing protein n=1 Tax=Telluribacter humicola TaxID=1720261 RepID=UPI001A9792A3|nr:DUF4190 domain-containing protein [Telluribacter humicola]
MSKPQFESYKSKKQIQPSSSTASATQPVGTVEEVSVIPGDVAVASAVEGVESVIAFDNASAAIPVEAIKEVHKVETAPAKLSWKERMLAGKLEKKISKATAPREAKADGQSKTVPRLSLIFGALGLVMLITGIVPGIAILFGIAGLILGIVGLSQIRKGESPRSSKAAALLGLIFGSAVILFLLLAIYAIAAFGFA